MALARATSGDAGCSFATSSSVSESVLSTPLSVVTASVRTRPACSMFGSSASASVRSFLNATVARVHVLRSAAGSALKSPLGALVLQPT